MVLFALDVNSMDFRVEGFSYLARRARKIDHHAAGVNNVDFEAVRLKPIRDLIEISIRWAEPLPEFPRTDPPVKVWRSRPLYFVEELLKVLVLLSRPAQLEHHVLQQHVIIHSAAIVFGFRFRSNITAQLYELSFIDILRYQGSRMASGPCLRLDRAGSEAANHDKKSE